jgi:hypothetical protein
VPNPWDKQPTAKAGPPVAGPLPCPVCGQPTEHLKQYEFVRWMAFYLVGAAYQTAHYRACPGCMRKLIAARAAWNVVPANLLWVVLVFPWALALFVATYRKGHSPAVLRALSEPVAAYQTRRVDNSNDVNWGRVLAICGLLFCWAPVVGLPLAGLAFWVNFRATNWTRRASAVALAVSSVVHLLLVLLSVGAAVFR